ncbi:phage tail component [Niallia circulans]|uniref:distal tail protein Dit n=3 Tax=Niallia circulans TaxID=1397 RepID=UPI00077C4FB0|nr:distal tail protein Dit [Niallia circulans]QKH61664.1 phage tail family protein [Niallia circulans]SPU10961.1 phage tail component [Niallia circulans]
MSFNITFNGHILPIKVRQVGGRGPIHQEVIGQSKPNSPGSYFLKRRLIERQIPVDFVLPSRGLSQTRKIIDALNSVLYVKEPSPITFSDEPDKTYFALMNGNPDWDEIVFRGRGTLPFLCPDPLKYGQEKTVTSTTIINEGTASCTPIFNVEFTESASEFRIQNEDGKFVRVIWAFVAGDKLVVDFKKRKITINYTVRMTSLDFSSNWFDLRPGENKLTVTPDGVAATTITYTPRWL